MKKILTILTILLITVSLATFALADETTDNIEEVVNEVDEVLDPNEEVQETVVDENLGEATETDMVHETTEDEVVEIVNDVADPNNMPDNIQEEVEQVVEYVVDNPTDVANQVTEVITDVATGVANEVSETSDELRTTQEDLIYCKGKLEYAGERIAELEALLTEAGVEVPEAAADLDPERSDDPVEAPEGEVVEPVNPTDEEFQEEVGIVQKLFGWLKG